MTPEELRSRYPAIGYFRDRAKRRIPHFAWEYLDSGTGVEAGLARNHRSFDEILFTPRFMSGFHSPDLTVRLFGRQWRAPLGIAPIGLSGLMWPGSELMFAEAAAARDLPYCLSMMACETPEVVGPLAQGRGWFQHYPFADRDAESDLLQRVAASGFQTLVVTVDVPINSTRERQRRAGFDGARRRINLSRLLQILARPQWTLATARRGGPSLRIIEKYVRDSSITSILEFVRDQQMGAADEDHLKRLRDLWQGPFVVKGILDPESAAKCIAMGADGVIVSNHGARQLDAAPAAIDVLPQISAEIGGAAAVLYDSGIRTGLDVARALARGADLVLAGRAFMYGVCVGGENGAGAVADLLIDDLSNNMMQIGARDIDGIADYSTN